MIEDLLGKKRLISHLSQTMIEAKAPAFSAKSRSNAKPEQTVRKGHELTRIDAIWLYTAGVSLVFPMVRKKSDSRAKTSARVVSSRLLYVVVSSLTAFNLWTVVMV
jgi:hypothetical protein